MYSIVNDKSWHFLQMEWKRKWTIIFINLWPKWLFATNLTDCPTLIDSKDKDNIIKDAAE